MIDPEKVRVEPLKYRIRKQKWYMEIAKKPKVCKVCARTYYCRIDENICQRCCSSKYRIPRVCRGCERTMKINRKEMCGRCKERIKRGEKDLKSDIITIHHRNENNV